MNEPAVRKKKIIAQQQAKKERPSRGSVSFSCETHRKTEQDRSCYQMRDGKERKGKERRMQRREYRFSFSQSLYLS